MVAILTEERLCNLRASHVLISDGPDSHKELSADDQREKDDTEPASVNTTGGLERKFFDRVALDLPSPPESNLGRCTIV